MPEPNQFHLPRMRVFLNIILTLSRASNLPTIWTNCLAAWVINQGNIHDLEWGVLGWLLLGGSLIYSAGCILNDAFDQKFDAEFNQHRPIPAGKITPAKVWVMGMAGMGMGGLILIFRAGCPALWVLLLVVAVLVYDILHKKWKGSVWIMGSCRTLLWLVAGTAGDHSGLELNTVIISTTLGLYVVGISLYARGEAKPNTDDKNLLPVLLLFLPCLLGLYRVVDLQLFEPENLFPALFGMLFMAWNVGRAVQIIRNRKIPGGIGAGVSLLLASICALDGLALCFHYPPFAPYCYLFFLISLILQKKFAAT